MGSSWGNVRGGGKKKDRVAARAGMDASAYSRKGEKGKEEIVIARAGMGASANNTKGEKGKIRESTSKGREEDGGR